MNFDRVVERRGTDSLKFDFAAERGRPTDVLPLWVADMDFPVAPEIQKALEDRVQHGIFGYTETKEDYVQAIAGWFARNHGWEPEKDWLIKTPGVVFALAMAVKAYTKPGEAVLIQTPVYYPFHEVVQDNDRKLVENQLRLVDGRYEIDFDALERQLREEQVRLMLLCSPHNPVGRVWTREELSRLAALCLQYHVTLVSDEIHCDFAWPGHPFTSVGALGGEILNQSVICTAPTKSFNLAGLQVSNIFIPNAELRRGFKRQVDGAGYSQMNTLGLTACKAAYNGGAAWLDAVRAYILGNLDFLRGYLAEKLPKVKLIEPEGTYLIWLDFHELGLSGEELEVFIREKARLWLDGGTMFGGDSGDFQRINIACPRATLRQALDQLAEAINALCVSA